MIDIELNADPILGFLFVVIAIFPDFALIRDDYPVLWTARTTDDCCILIFEP
jgi:hypothetical protein